MKTIYAFLFVSMSFGIYAQSWQWGKRGGGNIALGDFNWTERARQIKTDSQGNIYAICPIANSSINIDGNPKTGYSNGNTSDYAIVSFGCDGTYRWSKIIGGASTDILDGLQIDAQDNIYVTGRVVRLDTSVAAVHFDDDLTLPQTVSTENTNKQGLVIFKYTAAGALLWYRLPQPEDTSLAQNGQSRSLALSTDQDGNSFWFVRLAPSLYEGTYNVGGTVNSFHILKYDAEGNFLGGFPISMDSDGIAFNYAQMGVNFTTHTIYFAGLTIPNQSWVISFNGQPVTHDMYIAAYSGEGEFLWKKESSLNQSRADGFRSIFINTAGDIYLTGGTANGMAFDSHVFTSTEPHTFPFILKLNPNGEVIWGSNATTAAQGISFAITEGASTGSYAGNTSWGGYIISTPPNTAYDIYMTRFDPQTGQILGLEVLEDDNGYDDSGTAITKDLHGNFYVGGYFGHLLYVNSTIPMVNNGQQTDFFIAKFGSSNCTLSVNENTKTGLNFYPNPAHDRLTFSGQSNKKYTIFNALGQSVTTGVIDGNESIDVSRLANGVYLLKVFGERENQTIKFVKE